MILKVALVGATMVVELQLYKQWNKKVKIFPTYVLQVDNSPVIQEGRATNVAERMFSRLMCSIVAPVVTIALSLSMRFGINAKYFPIKYIQ
jgi:hypothetical protein